MNDEKYFPEWMSFTQFNSLENAVASNYMCVQEFLREGSCISNYLCLYANNYCSLPLSSTAFHSVHKWSQDERIAALQDVLKQVSELSLMWADAQSEFIGE